MNLATKINNTLTLRPPNFVLSIKNLRLKNPKQERFKMPLNFKIIV